MKLTRCCAVLAALVLGTTSHLASAATILFDFTAPDPQNNLTFTIDSMAVPTSFNDDWARFGNVTVTQQGRASGGTIDIGTQRWGGGFSLLGSPFHDFAGPVLFTGPVSAPQFTFGSFALSGASDSRIRATLTISQLVSPVPPAPSAGSGGSAAVPAVPEPGTWALLLLGFAATGAMLRRRGPAMRNVRFSVKHNGSAA